MSKLSFNFNLFFYFVLRMPIFSIDFFRELTKGTFIENDKIKRILNDSKIIKAFFLASPEFYLEVQKWLVQKNYPVDESDKIKLSLLKYLLRMSTRCTPFELFATCSSGKFTNKTFIEVNTEISFYRKTHFDMQFLSNFGKVLELNTKLKDKLLFCPNNTIYQLGDEMRYVEYFVKENNRKYSLEGLNKTEHLDLILKTTISGRTRQELTTTLISDKIDISDGIEFIDEVIDDQILVSKLGITLTGNDYINIMWDNTAKIDNNLESNQLKNQLVKINSEIVNTITSYQNIINTIQEIDIPFIKKYLFRTDLFLDSENFQLDKKHTTQIIKAINFLSKLRESPQNSSLQNLKSVFLERYDTETIPIVTALDIERGIDYLQKKHSFDISPILQSIGIKVKRKKEKKLSLTKIKKIIHNKVQNTLVKNKNSFKLNFSDFEKINLKSKQLSSTFSCLFEIIEEEGKEWIVIQNIGGSSEVNLLTRFCYGNEEINDFASEIIQYETDFFNEKIVAEIVHLPKTKTGNVLGRPNFRAYEISYLGQSNVPQSNQILIEDLLLSVKNQKLILWSKNMAKK